MYIYLFPFGFQYTFITLPQLGHFNDTIIQPEPVSPISQARFLHHLSGHFIFRIIPPPLPPKIHLLLSPRTDMEQREPNMNTSRLVPFIVCALLVFFLLHKSIAIPITIHTVMVQLLRIYVKQSCTIELAKPCLVI